MVLKNMCWLMLGVMLVASGAAMADEYRPDEFLGMDLSKAALSPKPLGPPAHFVQVPVKAKGDSAGDAASAVKGNGTIGSAAHAVATREVRVRRSNKVALDEARPLPAPTKPRGAARTRLAHRHHGNPLDALAMERRIQVWPCRSGGICNWQPAPGQE